MLNEMTHRVVNGLNAVKLGHDSSALMGRDSSYLKILQQYSLFDFSS